MSTITVPDDGDGIRLDRFLASVLPGQSRSRIQRLIKNGQVQVAGRDAKANQPVKEGQQVTVDIPEPVDPEPAAEALPLEVVYQDRDVIVVDKPAGMVVHPAAGHSSGTLVNALLHHFGTLSEVGGELRPGIVHRLDRATSGLMVVAKNDLAHHKLAEQFSNREVHKTYLALIHGWPKKDHGTIRNSISRDVQRRIRMTTRRSGGREAVTHFVVQRKLDTPYGKFALIEVKIETGRTHQIRVHMSSLGHPVVGDALYGAARELRSQSGKVRAAEAQAVVTLERNFLHSAVLELTHPRTGALLRFSRGLPVELEDFLGKLAASGGLLGRPSGT